MKNKTLLKYVKAGLEAPGRENGALTRESRMVILDGAAMRNTDVNTAHFHRACKLRMLFVFVNT